MLQDKINATPQSLTLDALAGGSAVALLADVARHGIEGIVLPPGTEVVFALLDPAVDDAERILSRASPTSASPWSGCSTGHAATSSSSRITPTWIPSFPCPTISVC